MTSSLHATNVGEVSSHFCFENPCENYGRNYLFLDAVGKGALSGATFGIQVHRPEPDAWYHGGGDSIFLDGGEQPEVLHGIGAEDFFGHSWGVREFQSPTVGVPYREIDEEGAPSRVAFYRRDSKKPLFVPSCKRAGTGS